jgi:hypothetical protein
VKFRLSCDKSGVKFTPALLERRNILKDSSGVYICNSIVNDLRHGNYICKSEGIYLGAEKRAVFAFRERQVETIHKTLA